MTDHTLTTPDGRTLDVLEDGDPSGVPVLLHNGTPNSKLLFAPDVERARRAGVRWISYNRPGYGGSSRQPGRTVADCANDVRTIAGGLGIDRLAVMGISGGGPHALACAALLDDLVPAVASLCSPAPFDAEGLDFFAGMGQDNVDDVQLRLKDDAAADAKAQADREELLSATTAGILEHHQTLLSPIDAAVFTGEFAAFMMAMLHDGLGPGADGWCDDDRALADWGFELTEITTPVLQLHGRQDQFVPFAHGQWLADHIPGVEARLFEEDGHLTLVANHLDEVFDWLLARM